jgi:CBS domain-containing protein
MTQVKEVMSSKPKTCTPDASIIDVAKLMAKEDVGPVPIVQDDRLVGLVTDRDLVLRVLAEGRDPKSMRAADVASSDLVTVSPDDDLDRALQLLAKNQVRRLPVVEGGRLVGIVAQRDIALQGQDRETGQVVEEISR